ncbi:MAG TPA: hypothetical protein VFC47_03960 [Caulobacteraceae bacterium]|nr:hypothetical protein [Caulobacteraceae bacterium]
MSTLALSQRITGAVTAAAGQTDFPADFPALPVGGPYVGLFISLTRGASTSTLVVGADFTVADIGPAAFTAVLNVPAQAGDVVIVYGDLPAARTVALVPGGAIQTAILEADATSLQAQIQELDRDGGAAVRGPVGEQFAPLPPAAQRLGKVLAFDPTTGAPSAATPPFVSYAGSPFFSSVVAASLATIAAGTAFLVTAGYAAPGDGAGEAVYTPAAPGAGAGKFQSADGQWWQAASLTLASLQATLLSAQQTFAEVAAASAGVGAGAAGTPPLDPGAVVANVVVTNLANPNVADPALTAPDYSDQIYCYWHNAANSGTLTAQSQSTIPTLAASRRYPQVAGQQYTVSIAGAPLDFIIELTAVPFLDFFNPDHSFNSALAAGALTCLPSSVATRTMTWTAPITGWVAFNFQDGAASAGSPTTQARVDACLNAVMLNTGPTVLPFAAWQPGAYAPTNALFTTAQAGVTVITPGGPTIMVLQAGYLYVRAPCQASATEDLVWRISYGATPTFGLAGGLNLTGVMDFVGYRIIPRSTLYAATVAAFNSAVEVHAGVDEETPVSINDAFVGANHYSISYYVTATAHGMTNVDVGSIWNDTNAIPWVLSMIVDANTLCFTIKNQGTATSWLFPGVAPPGATFVHVSGATHTGPITFSAPLQVQRALPGLFNYIFAAKLDGVILTTTIYTITATAGGGNTGTGTIIAPAGAPPGMSGAYALAWTSGTVFALTDPNGNALPAGALGVPYSAGGSSFNTGGAPLAGDTFALTAVQTVSHGDGVYQGNLPEIDELYSILNPASQQSSLIAAVGATAPNYAAANIAEQVRCFFGHSWNAFGALTSACSELFAEDFARYAGALGDYAGFMQRQRNSLQRDTPAGIALSTFLYAPNVTPVGGLDFLNLAEITNNAVATAIPASAGIDPVAGQGPPSHFCELTWSGAAGAGACLSGEVYGYSRSFGLGVPAARTASIINAMLLSAPQKQYLCAVDSKAGGGVAGTIITVTAFRAPFRPDASLTIPAVVVGRMGPNGESHCYIASHQAQAAHVVTLPAALGGRPLSVIKGDPNVQINRKPTVVAGAAPIAPGSVGYALGAQLILDVAGAYGDVVLVIS